MIIALTAVMLYPAVNQVIAQKIGHLNVQEVMAMLPERKGLEEQVQTFAKELENTYGLMTTEYQNKLNEFQQLPPDSPESIKETKIQDLQQLEQRIKEFEVKAQQDLAQKEQDLLQPLIEKMKDTIKKVAESNGYTYILDSGVGVILHAGGDDVAKLVKKELGLE